MDGDIVLLLIGLGTGASFLVWAGRPFDLGRLSARDDWPPEEPCWTERISTDGRLSYGRHGCYHSDLAEADARARSAEFNAYG